MAAPKRPGRPGSFGADAARRLRRRRILRRAPHRAAAAHLDDAEDARAVHERGRRDGVGAGVCSQYFDLPPEAFAVGSIALLVPGLTLTTAISELADQNLASGTTKLMKGALNDTHDVSVAPAYGPEGTFNAFKFDAPMKQRIDYIFVSSPIKVLKYGVLTDAKDQRYPSDHQPVVAKIVFY